MTDKRRRMLWVAMSLLVAGVLALVIVLILRGRGYPPGGYPSVDGLAPGSAEALARQRAAVREYGLPLEVKNSLGMRFRLIPAGTFTMGSPEGEAWRDDDETPQTVTLTKPFYLGVCEVTQGEWEEVMGSTPSYFKDAGRRAPVEQVSWDDCQEFIRKLCELEGVPPGTYRLPTEAEWEYACRAGTTTAFYSGACTQPGGADPNLDRIGWYWENSLSGFAPTGKVKVVVDWIEKQVRYDFLKDPRQTTHPRGRKDPNAWGLYDMSGNVWEWCGDWYGPYTGDAVDPKGPEAGSGRVCRGGSWGYIAGGCRSADRIYDPPGHRFYDLGLRLLRMP